MKRFVFAVIILGLFLNFASAAGCSAGGSSNESIISLYAITNSHLALWNDSVSTPYEVCFNETFGFSYYDSHMSEDVHACKPGNTNAVVWLTGTANAHASTVQRAGYNVPICYGDLVCTAQTGSCPVGTSEVLSLTGTGNAHAEFASANLFLNPTLICCSTGGSSGGWSVQWRDVHNQQTFSTTVNKTVRLYAQTPASPGTKINFSIYDEDSFDSDDFIANVSAVTDSSGVATYDLFISDMLADKGKDFAETSPLEFYFFAYSPAQKSQQSAILEVNYTEGSNIPPTVLISSPVHRGVYYKDTTVMMNASVLDDGMITNYLWTISDGSSNLITSTQKNFTYTFNSEGQRIITLKVTDNNGVSRETQVGVSVVASPGGLAFINVPSHMQTIINSLLIAQFSANDSYIINSSGSPCPTSVKCIAGNCPSTTENAPNGCNPQKITITGTPQPITQTYFNWAFNDGDDGTGLDGYAKDTINKRFGTPSTQEGDKRADLIINYTNAGNGIGVLRKTSRSFTLLDARQCIDNGNTWVEYSDITGEEIARYSTLNTNRCSGKDGLYGNADDCCPSGWACTTTGCQPSEVDKCSDYTNKTTCNDDPFNVVKIDPFWNSAGCGTVQNGTLVVCSCLWEGTSETSGSCNLFANGTSNSGNNGVCTYSSCSYSSTATSECVNGYATVNVVANFIAGTCSGGVTQEQCVSGPRTILCGKPTIALSFFDIWQFVSVIIFIGVIYFLAVSRRR